MNRIQTSVVVACAVAAVFAGCSGDSSETNNSGGSNAGGSGGASAGGGGVSKGGTSSGGANSGGTSAGTSSSGGASSGGAASGGSGSGSSGAGSGNGGAAGASAGSGGSGVAGEPGDLECPEAMAEEICSPPTTELCENSLGEWCRCPALGNPSMWQCLPLCPGVQHMMICNIEAPCFNSMSQRCSCGPGSGVWSCF